MGGSRKSCLLSLYAVSRLANEHRHSTPALVSLPFAQPVCTCRSFYLCTSESAPPSLHFRPLAAAPNAAWSYSVAVACIRIAPGLPAA